MAAGETRQTKSGRETTPFPKIHTTNNRAASLTLKKVEQWLLDNGRAEAESQKDQFFQTQLKNEKAGKLPPATIEAINLYLFD